jgi:hypothetical protein
MSWLTYGRLNLTLWRAMQDKRGLDDPCKV